MIARGRGPLPNPNSKRTRDGKNTATSKWGMHPQVLQSPEPYKLRKHPPGGGVLSKEAEKFFRKYQPMLAEKGKLTEATYPDFLLLCEVAAGMARARIAFAKKGGVQERKDGQTVISAELRFFIHMEKMWRKNAKAWGFLPTEGDFTLSAHYDNGLD